MVVQLTRHSQISFHMFLVASLTASVQSATIPATTLNVSVKYGNNASLTCIADTTDGLWVRWDKEDTGHIIALETHVIVPNTRVSVSLEDKDKWTLHIRNVKEEDHGSYRCTVNTSPVTYKTFYLDVLEVPVSIPPTIRGPSNNTIIARERSTVDLFCNTTGYPEPKVIWTREDKQVIHLLVNNTSPVGVEQWMTLSQTSFEGETLRLPLVSRADAGLYRCTANNSVHPVAFQVIDLEVAFPPDKVTVVGPRDAKPGQQVKFSCVVKNSNPPAELSWTVENKPRPAISTETMKTPVGGYDSKSTLSVTIPYAISSGKMMFTCLAINRDLGVMEVDSYILPILEPDPQDIFQSEIEEYTKAPSPGKGFSRVDTYVTDDINPKRGREQITYSSGGSVDETLRRRKTSSMRGTYYDMVVLLRLFGLLMPFH